MFKTLLDGRLVAIFSSLLLLVTSASFAARLKDDDGFYLKHLRQQSYEVDSSAPAIILYEKKLVTISTQAHRGLIITEEIRRIIKVLKKAGSSSGDVSIPVLHNNDYYSEIKKVRGTTYNLVNGAVVKHELDGKNIQETKSYNLITSKFSLPAIKDGSVIEYSYTVDRDFNWIFCFWEFQSEIPRLYSEVEVQVPGVCNVVSISQNSDPFVNFDDKKFDPYDTRLPTSYVEGNYTNGQEYLVKKWVRRNVPAAFDEPYTNNFRNYTESLLLQLTGFQDRGFKWATLDSWKAFNKSLYESSAYYGKLSSLNGTVKDKVNNLVSGTGDSVQKAKHIYRYVRNYIKSENSSDFIARKSLNEVYKDKVGTPSEVNFLLMAMLHQAGYDVSPVVIGTNDVLRPLATLPVLERTKKSICLLRLGEEKIYLDASEPYTPFGILPADCYNGFSWIVSKKGESVNLEPEAIKEKQLVSLTGSMSSSGRAELEVKHYLGSFTAIEYRSEYLKDSAALYGALLKEARKLNTSAKISGLEVIGFRNADTGMVLHYFLSFDFPETSGQIFLAPQFIRYFQENPFKSAVRNYPVELPSAMDLNYSLQLKMPAGWELTENTKPGMLELDELDSYKYSSDFDKESGIYRMNSRLQLKRTYFPKDDYDLIKVFFDKLMELQDANCILKKTS